MIVWNDALFLVYTKQNLFLCIIVWGLFQIVNEDGVFTTQPTDSSQTGLESMCLRQEVEGPFVHNRLLVVMYCMLPTL